MKHLGDITKINGAEIEPVDVVTGGSPCQDLSSAGKRAGLAGARSGLFMEQIRIVKEMRASERERGVPDELCRPRYMVWENVPGAFSSNGGKDFAAVLEEIIRIAEPEAPDIEVPEKGWPTWGGYHDRMGGRWSVVWRVHDAQHWGVPQRRRRISIVADFGGDTASEISFERKSVSGDTEPGGTEGQGFTPGAEKGVDGASCAVRIRGGCDGGGKGALVQTEVSGTLGCNNDQTIFYAIGSYHSNAWKSDNPNSGVYETDVAKTLDAINCGYPGCNQGGTAVVYLNDQGGNIMSVSDGVSATLRAQEYGHQPCILDISHRGDVVRECGELVPSPCAKAGTGGNNVPVVTYQQVTGPLMANSHPGGVTGQDAQNDMLVVTAGQYGEYKQGCGTLRAAGGDLGGGSENLVVAVDCRNGTENHDVNGMLQAKSNGGFSYNLQNVVRVGKRVRRLTPLECERLQGFPDGWTDIGDWYDSKGKLHRAADSPRYKALGNSIALPFWDFLAKRISAQYPRSITMGSLFDGIGGFPLVFERYNGEGRALWASEIEEFPIAVTKLRFGEEA